MFCIALGHMVDEIAGGVASRVTVCGTHAPGKKSVNNYNLMQ
jgi:hypothetical protein